MSALRITAPLLAVALGAVAGLTTSPSATAVTSRAPGDSCLLRAQAVKVKNVQHDASGTDAAVFVRLGNSSTITRSSTVPQTRKAWSG